MWISAVGAHSPWICGKGQRVYNSNLEGLRNKVASGFCQGWSFKTNNVHSFSYATVHKLHGVTYKCVVRAIANGRNAGILTKFVTFSF